MITYNPLLCLDFYKTCHAEQYPKGLTKMVSYYTPRMSRLGDTGKVTLFGLQAFIREYLVEAFNEHFFNAPFDSVLKEYDRVLGATIGTQPFCFCGASPLVSLSAYGLTKSFFDF